jgi:8-oxo-dGTP pyrophosphatase MutT (NUDIX family)
MIAVAKVLIEIDGAYLFAGKSRARDRGRLELLGGHVDAEDDGPFEALLRELREEEETGLLAKEISRIRPAGEKFQIGHRLQHVYRCNLGAFQWQALRPNRKEVSTFVLVQRETIETPEYFQQNAKLFTDMTKKLFEAMYRQEDSQII